MPLLEAVKRDSTLRASEFGWMMETQWGTRPPLRGVIGTRRVADRVIGSLKRQRGGMAGVVQQMVGVLLGVVLAFVGIPALVVGLFLLISASFLWLPVVLLAWLVGVILLLSRALRPKSASSAFRRAIARLEDLSYCPDCDVIYETETGRVVQDAQLHELLYAERGASGAEKRLVRS